MHAWIFFWSQNANINWMHRVGSRWCAPFVSALCAIQFFLHIFDQTPQTEVHTKNQALGTLEVVQLS